MVGVEVLGGVDAEAPPDAIAGEPGGDELPSRVIEDAWAEPVARRVLRALLMRQLAPDGNLDHGLFKAGTMIVLPAPEGEAPSLGWLTEASQGELDAWRRAAPGAEAVLRAVGRWLGGQTRTLDAAYAGEFPAEVLMEAFLARLDGRAKALLTARLEGQTLREIGDAAGITHARVSQISTKAARDLAADLARAQAASMPAAQALAHHARSLAERVLASASEEEGVLRSEDRRRWIRRALPPAQAKVLAILDEVVAEMPREVAVRFDHFSQVGRPLAGGRTLMPWCDADLERLRGAFDTASRGRRFALAAEVAGRASLPDEAVARLAPFAGLSVHGPVVMTCDGKVADLRGGYAASVLASAERPLHQAEVFVAGLAAPSPPEWTYLGVIQALQTATDVFRSNGNGLWTLRTGHGSGDEVVDRRPECPSIDAASGRHPFEPRFRGRLLEGLDPSDPAFSSAAAGRIGEALQRLPGERRRSVAEVLGKGDDLRALLAWLQADWRQAEVLDDASTGLTVLAASVAAARREAGGGWGTWEAFRTACGTDARRTLFGAQGAPDHWALSAMLRAVHMHRLRHALDHRGDAWVTLLRLQWGFGRGDLGALRGWLRGDDQPPPGIRHLAADPATGMAELWSALSTAAAGGPNAGEALAAAAALPWWPGWSVPEVLARFAEPPRHSAPGTHGEDGASRRGDGPCPNGATGPRSSPFLAVRLGEAADRFEVKLPARLPFPPGPVVASGHGFRVGGSIGSSGDVTWHHGTGWIALPLRGPSEREVRFEVGAGEPPAPVRVRLWDPQAFLLAYDLAGSERGALDPYVAGLSPSGPHALVLHETLLSSVAADEEGGLDDAYRLLLYGRGLPDGLEVVCEGQVVWGFQRRERCPVLDVPPAVLSGNGGDLGWGETCALDADGLPDGFVPSRACVGGQTLHPNGGGPPWRFEGYTLLPGADPLRRKGRIEGRLDGRRVAVPAVVHVRRPVRGAALRGDGTVRHLLATSTVDRTRDAGSRLWVSRTPEEASLDHVVLEGVRPAARHGHRGARLCGTLIALGEPLFTAPGVFNRAGRSMPVAAAVFDRGVVSSASAEGGALRLTFSAPLSWGERHRVHGWGGWGVAELSTRRVSPDGLHVDVAWPGEEPAGVAVCYGDAWLGSAYLCRDAVGETARLLQGGNPVDRLAFALSARLPLLGDAAVRAASLRLRRAGRDALGVLLRGDPDSEGGYVAGRLLARWEPADGEAVALVQDFAAAIERPRSQTVLLERLAVAVPCAAVRVLRAGMNGMGRPEQKRLLAALLVRAWPAGLPDEHRAPPSPRDPDRCVAEAEAVLLDQACRATRTDRRFLASRSEASVASLAWSAATLAPTREHPENLATALALPPVRRWITAHLLARLVQNGR